MEHQQLMQQLKKLWWKMLSKLNGLVAAEYCLCNSKRVAQVCNFSCTPSWQEKIMVADISNLMQNFNNINENGYVPFNK